MLDAVFADALILRCDAKDGGVVFCPDRSSRPLVHSIGFATKVETEGFSDTVTAASSNETSVAQILIIDRINRPIRLSWSVTSTTEKGGSYQGGVCAAARRLF